MYNDIRLGSNILFTIMIICTIVLIIWSVNNFYKLITKYNKVDIDDNMKVLTGKQQNNIVTEHQAKKPFLWYFNQYEKNKIPAYIELCIETIKKRCDYKFTVIELNKQNVSEYLPQLRKDIDYERHLNYVKVAMLFYYGGIWIDIASIVTGSLYPIMNKLESFDFVGFGCSKQKCFDGYPYPLMKIMGANKGSILMKEALKSFDVQLNSHKYEIDASDLWVVIDVLLKKGYSYHHFNAIYDGSRDSHGNVVDAEDFLRKKETMLFNPRKVFIFTLDNDAFMKDPRYNWFTKLTKDQIMNDRYWVTKLFRKSLK
jgi:hypothetical protein